MSLLSPNLLAFMAIVKHKTVHSAASAIHLTQTAVTQRIRSLEKNLKITLFVRTRRGMLLTQEGEALLRYCIAAKALEGEALAHIQKTGLDTEVELTISAPTSIMRARIVPACLPIMKKFPKRSPAATAQSTFMTRLIQIPAPRAISFRSAAKRI